MGLEAAIDRTATGDDPRRDPDHLRRMRPTAVCGKCGVLWDSGNETCGRRRWKRRSVEDDRKGRMEVVCGGKMMEADELEGPG